MPVKSSPLPLAGAALITPRRFGDSRGWFCEHFSVRAMADAGLNATFVQDNLSYSAKAGTLRGLHYQAPPAAQGKLVSVITGAVLDVLVDVRTGSPTFGEHLKVELSADNGQQVWVPAGFLHGFLTLTDDVHMLYKVTAPYSADHDGSIAWNDPSLGIDWGIHTPTLSDKDKAAPLLSAAGVLFPKGWDLA